MNSHFRTTLAATDDADTKAVPEPGSWALMLAGAAALLARRRRVAGGKASMTAPPPSVRSACAVRSTTHTRPR